MKIMRNSTFLPLTLLLIVFFLNNPTSATSGTDYNYGAHPRFVCTPLPVEADPSCFTKAGPGAGSAGPGGPGPQNAPPGSWVGASEEAKATILHLRESLVQQKEIILNQRETLRELTAKLTLCEGVGRGMSLHDERHSLTLHHRAHHHSYADSEHHGNQQVHHRNSNLIPDSPHPPSSEGGQRFDGVKGKQVTLEESTSSVQQMERMLQALKERLNNLQQKRNTSSAYSSSLKELLQRKISTLEEQLHRHTATLGSPDRHGGVSPRGDGGDGTDDDKVVGKNAGRYGDEDDEEEEDGDRGDDDEDSDDEDSDDEEEEDSDGEDDSDSEDEDDSDDEDDKDDDNDDVDDDDDEEERKDDDDDDDDEEDDDDVDREDDEDNDDDIRNNEAGRHSYLPHTYRTGFHSNKLETMLHQLHLKGSNRKKSQKLDAFQISFPMRTNYMYGRMKKTLMQEIFALTLCLWLKAGVGGSGLGTPFSYSAPGQANELVLIEWENNPIELLIDDKAASLPLSLNDGKWHHVCVTWTTRDGQWEAYQDGVQRGSGMNLSPWRSIKPGGVFVLGQEQDTLGGRFDATQSYVGEMSDLNMWSHVLSSSDVYSLASCGSHLRGDVITWSETEVELHGGVARYPFDPCH